jgi:glycerol-3-phosphate acyltransferase PlsY
MTENLWVFFVAFPLAGYVIGSTPFGPIIARFHGVDLRARGSGNVGATNVGRALGRRWGYLCFLLDVAKGLVPTLVAGMLLRLLNNFPTQVHQGAWLAVGLGCILGHVLSFWLGFRGGKGVATSLGVVLGVFPYFTYAGLAVFGLWAVVSGVSRYVSVGSITAAVAFWPLFAAINWFAMGLSPRDLWPLGAFAAAMAVLIVFLHRGNIRRLLTGRENKIGDEQAGDSRDEHR